MIRRPCQGARDHCAAAHIGEELICFGPVIVNPLAISPASRREIEGGHVIFLAVRGDEFAHADAVGPRLPGKKRIRRMIGGVIIQVGFRPVPERVEFRFFIQLGADDHAVGQPFGPDIVVVNIRDVGQGTVRIAARGKIHGLRFGIAVKQLLPGGLDFLFHLGARMPGLGEQVSIAARRVGARAIGGGFAVVSRFTSGNHEYRKQQAEEDSN